MMRQSDSPWLLSLTHLTSCSFPCSALTMETIVAEIKGSSASLPLSLGEQEPELTATSLSCLRVPLTEDS